MTTLVEQIEIIQVQLNAALIDEAEALCRVGKMTAPIIDRTNHPSTSFLKTLVEEAQNALDARHSVEYLSNWVGSLRATLDQQEG